MKKIVFYLFPLLFLFVAATIFGFRSTSQIKEKPAEKPHRDVSQTFIKEEVFTESPSKYKISSYKGKVALFEIRNDVETLLEQYDTSISSLRERDASLLRQGIFFNSHSEAYETLENFIN